MRFYLRGGAIIRTFYDETIYKTTVRAFELRRPGDSITLQGSGSPMSIEFNIDNLERIELDMVEALRFP